MSIRYLDDVSRAPLKFREEPLNWQKAGLTWTKTGYGAGIATTRKVFFDGRWYRIYFTCYGNAASQYIKSKGEHLFIRQQQTTLPAPHSPP